MARARQVLGLLSQDIPFVCEVDSGLWYINYIIDPVPDDHGVQRQKEIVYAILAWTSKWQPDEIIEVMDN